MATQKIRLMVDGLTEDTTPDIDADYLMTNDASASLQKKVKPANIVGTVLAALRSAFTPASASSAASLALAEDTDNGTNKITVTAPATIASDKTQTLQDATDTFVYRDTTDTLTNKTLSGATLSGVIDAGGATSFEIPNDAAPTVNADGEIALDTSVADFSHGIPKIYGGEELAFVVLPIAALTTPTNGHVIKYNSTNDEFELGAGGGGIGGSTGATDNSILRADGTGGSTVQNSDITIDDNGGIAVTLGDAATVGYDMTLAAAATGNAFKLKANGGSQLLAITKDGRIEFNSSTNTIFYDGASTIYIDSGGSVNFRPGGTNCLQIDNNATAGNTRLLVYDVDNATLERVSVGAADSGGTGYKVLRIPN